MILKESLSSIGFNMTGRQLRQAVLFMMRDEAVILGNHCENFQFSKGFSLRMV